MTDDELKLLVACLIFAALLVVTLIMVESFWD